MNRLNQLGAFLGCWGVKTRQMNSEEIVEMAKTIYEIKETGIEEIAIKIESLGKQKRRELASKNLAHYGVSLHQKLDKTKITTAGLEKMMADSSPKMIDGDSMDVVGELDIDPAQLLQKVVTAVIIYGQQEILWEFPEVLAFFGSRMPNRSELDGHHNVNERMFEAKKKWPNLKQGLDL